MTTQLEPLASWSRVERDGDVLDVLDVRGQAAKKWCFVWPGRIIIQALGDGIRYRASDDEDVLPRGGVLVAGAFAARLRIAAAAMSSFRVLFELGSTVAALVTPTIPTLRVLPDLRSDPDPFALFHAALATPLSSTRVVGPVGKACAYVAAHYTDDFELETLGRMVGLERAHLCRCFRQTIGLPPYRLRAQLRAAQARALLATDMQCMSIAHAVGYYDQSHFSRSFKDLYGTSPRKYKTACQNGSPASIRRNAFVGGWLEVPRRENAVRLDGGIVQV